MRFAYTAATDDWLLKEYHCHTCKVYDHRMTQPDPICDTPVCGPTGQPGGEARQCCGTQPCLALKVVQQAVDVLASTASARVAAAFFEPRKRMMSCVDARLIAAVPVVPPSTTWHHPREALRPLAASMRRAPLDSLSWVRVGARCLGSGGLVDWSNWPVDHPEEGR